MTTQLINSLPPTAGLNPKAYRMPSPSSVTPGVEAGVGRNIVDGSVLARWTELATGKRTEIAGRVGFNGGPQEVRGEIARLLGWSGMAYF
jgi:cleavage and polyadenylation specificity factor subunit 1